MPITKAGGRYQKQDRVGVREQFDHHTEGNIIYEPPSNTPRSNTSRRRAFSSLIITHGVQMNKIKNKIEYGRPARRRPSRSPPPTEADEVKAAEAEAECPAASRR
ncbi:hypothetical protein Cob_v006171 [Colletotrichum orbiculare MAFF 240422]|uniref:Uncharacterized protein n=1 Tax=Colletotrichum orbiculare (strain 104-T / ATCC 96160 / CBS 514.97 / LARS 414 / MAFF 240422) TaxID=1213857 RepID=A0A484FT35_COLOR|nr:hypothetical protein Cob_v006171 [Colletotrichum orbiculare MAFF 240422]